LVRVLDQYLADLQAGLTPDRAQLLADHPEMASQLEQCLAGIEFIHRAGKPAAGAPSQLGDFRILHEMGRGGMGVVYEAEQVSLRRRVALKVLRFGAVADAELLQRFQREAKTVAHLHHTNIVPIFAVGCEQGVHYYAMQLIDGRSLDAVYEEARQAGRLLDAKEVTRWCLQAAEALAHAHQRGVIHRDIKPSNLLLDGEGTVWLTDFGLAKRVDEVTLTVAGALLGTPRYMSPEQASAVKKPVDQRTDIYSLGAALYELATGQPVFDADTPERVLSQIQNNEPVAPRQARPSLPRDLETVILKCLNKEASRRYATAQELAADLRAFLEGRAIRARRPSLAEKAARWARKQRSSAVAAAVAAAAAVLLLVGSYFAWGWYTEGLKGQLVLTTDGPGLEAEVLKDNDELVLPPFAVSAAPQTISLPARNYRVRLSAPGPLSETYHVVVEQGVQQPYEVRLGDRQFWPPLDVTKGFEVVELDGRSDVILVTDTGLRRVNGAAGKDVWQRSLKKADQPAMADSKEYEWPLGNAWYGPPSIDPPYGVHPWLVRPAPDLEGDGNPYLVWACRPAVFANPWLLAVSAKDGMVKWWYSSQQLAAAEAANRTAAGVVCPPLVEDVDGDGKPDVIATFGEVYQKGPPPWVEAISGRTGRLIWRYVFDRDIKAPVSKEDNWRDTRYSTLVLREDGQRILVVLAGRCLVGLDLQTGKEAWPVRELDFEPLATPVIADLTGDGRPALLLLKSATKQLIGGDLRVIALSLSGRPLWEHPMSPTSQSSSRIPELEWPVVADLDGDGKPEVIIPYHNARLEKNGWVGIEVLEGATGQSRWRSRLSRGYRGAAEYIPIAHFVVGPDLDGDGCRDIFTAALIDEASSDQTQRLSRWLVVAANSGADGRILWRSLRPVDGDAQGLGPLRWGLAGADGRPQLAVSLLGQQIDWLRNETKGTVAQTLLFSSSDGKLEHHWRGVSRVDAADFNGDGIPDLYSLRLDTEHFGKLYGLRGGTPETRQLGTWQPAVTGRPHEDGQTLHVVPPLPHGDLDGDGIPDAIVFHPLHWTGTDQPPALYTCSGKDGHRLWQVDALPGTTGPNTLASKCYWLECQDLDGSGRPEVLITYRLGQEGSHNQGWLAVLSGRNGKVLWKHQLGGFAIHVDGGWSETFHNASQQPSLVDLKGNGVLSFLVTVQSGRDRQELHALEARTGRVLWKHTLEPRTMVGTVVRIGELPNGSGSGDLLVTFSSRDDPPHTPFRIKRLSGQDGQAKWTWSAAEDTECHQYPILVDLDGDGRRSACMLIHNKTRERYQILILDPRGQLRQTLDLKPPSSNSRFSLWSHDLAGDGKEDLLVVYEDRVQALLMASAGRQPPGRSRWECRLPEGLVDLVGIHPAAVDRGAVVVARSAKVLYGLDGPTGKRLWEAPLPSGVRGVFGWDTQTPGIFSWPRRNSGHDETLGFQRAPLLLRPVRPAMFDVVVCSARLAPSDSRIEGLDPVTGQARWRCEAPGQGVVLLPSGQPGEPPKVWFHTLQPASTVRRQALSVDANGRYGSPAPAPVVYGPDPGDPWTLVPLPWINPARLRLPGALLPGMACLALLSYFALWRRRRTITIGLLVCAVAVPVVVAAFELHSWENWIAPEQRHAWGGWYWIWPYVLSVPADYAVVVPLAVVVVAVLLCLPLKWRLIGLGLLAILPSLYVFLSSSGPGQGRPWWEYTLKVPGGLTSQSPLVWMLVWLYWIGRPVFGNRRAA
jgi:outer membrane protein assembly factor BamB/tRNA A-37 threonylcarbamoyl transferase component Bud32